jgi:hypothetical protein
MKGIFKTLWQGWKRIAHKIGEFQSRLILSLFYYVLFAPFAIGVKFFSDPLQIKKYQGWLLRNDGADDSSVYARRQY